jgi:CBS domain-containing protein
MKTLSAGVAKLADLMVAEVVTISPKDTTAAAARAMKEKGVGCLVVTADGAVKGILTDRDLLGCLSQGDNPAECAVANHMSRPVVVERPDEEIVHAAEIMADRKIKRLPVVEHGRLLGIISFSDIAKWMSERTEEAWTQWNSITRLIKAQARQTGAQTGRYV